MSSHLSAIVGARISEFRRRMRRVRDTIRDLPSETRVRVTVVTQESERRLNAIQDQISRIANSIRAFGTVGANMFQGSMLMVSPALVPIIAAAVGLLGTLGPMIAVAGSNTFALAAAFGIAGGAAVGFGAAAIPTIQSIIDGTAKSTKENVRAMKALDKLKSTWSGVQDAIAPQTANAFASAMTGIEKALSSLNPMFKSVAGTVADLSSRFDKFMGSKSAQQFFGYLNTSAAPILDKVMSGLGGLIQGFMNLTVAFAPMTDFMAQGFKNMGQSFVDFTERIKGSTALQNFISYLQTNGPKIWAIVKNITLGLIGMFTAFGPLASDMMTGFQNLTARFKEWGQALSENQQFQKFIGYIQANAPTVIALIGNITTFLVNLGIAIAPIGAKVLQVVNNIIAWTSSMMAANPVIGQTIAILVMIAGGFMALLPPIIAVRTAFAGLPGFIISSISKIIPFFTSFVGKIAMGFVRMSTSGALWVGKTVSYIAKVIAKYAVLAAKATLHAAKVALTFTVTMIKAAAKATASMIVSMAKIIAKYAVLAAKSMIHAARVAASWLIAMGPVGWVIATVVALVALIIANWDKIKSWTTKTFSKVVSVMREKMNDAKQKVSNILDNIKSFFTDMDLYASGKAIIQSAIDGLMAMKNKIVSKVEGIVGAVRDLWPFSPAKEGPLSDIHRMDFGGPITKSITRAKKPIMSSMTSLAASARNAFTPNIALANIGGTATFDTSFSDGTRAIEHAFNAEVNEIELPDREEQYAVINIGGHEAQGVIKYISGEQNRASFRQRRRPN
ncbi:hypothetical protein MKX67_18300 [Cytobacillus sp. FSL W7-1323]|uniref:phage tail protein n=1 Tax=Cytobacillus sp. FSL W7-1323 TaxID=2921700 RepID=UPI0031587D64